MDQDAVLRALDRPQPHRFGTANYPTGVFGLDLALGGGLPSGRITELYGDTGTGKTTVAYHAAARAQAAGTVLWADSGGFSPKLAHGAGVDLDRLVVLGANDVATTLRMLRIAAPDCALMVLDTATGLHEVLDFLPELNLLRAIGPRGPAVLVTSNLRLYAPVTGYFSDVLRAAASVRVKLGRENDLRRAYVIKNTLTPPASHPIRFRIENGAIDWAHELVLLGLETGVLHQRGSWVWWTDDMVLGQGVDNAARTIRGRQLGLEIRGAVTSCLT